MILRRLRRTGEDKKKEERERSRMGIRMVRVIMMVVILKKKKMMRIPMELKL